MTFQTSLGFGLTFLTIQTAPLIAQETGWPFIIFLLALGPLFGVWSMKRLERVSA
jgi:hypothetical protein